MSERDFEVLQERCSLKDTNELKYFAVLTVTARANMHVLAANKERLRRLSVLD